MKLYLKRPVAAKLAQALAKHPDADIQGLARHLKAKADMESRFLTATDLEGVLAVLDAGLDDIRRNGGGLGTTVDYRRALAARPKLVAFLESTRKREAQGRDADEDAD